MESARRNRFRQKPVAADLRPVGEGRFIETILIVEIRNDVIASLDHLARRFGKTRLVAIDQRQAPRADDVKGNAGNEQQRVIADTDFRRVLAIYRSCVTQLADSRIPGG